MAVTLVIHHAKRMPRMILSSVASWLHHIFPHDLINGTILGGEKLLNVFFLTFYITLSQTSVIIRRIQPHIINTHRASYEIPTYIKFTHYSCQILMALEFSGQIFEKYSNIKFLENHSSGSPVVPC
jgi:hypothetical protein